jgi:hypothetical protein
MGADALRSPALSLSKAGIPELKDEEICDLEQEIDRLSEELENQNNEVTRECSFVTVYGTP